MGYSSLPTRPYSSLSGGYADLTSDPFGMDNSQSYLAGGGGALEGGGGVLRDTAIGGGVGMEDEDRHRYLASRRFVGVASAGEKFIKELFSLCSK